MIEQYQPLRFAIAQIAALGGGGGYSGSRLWRIVAADGSNYCLRRWPVEHPTAERLQFIHNVLVHVAAKMPVVACPLRTMTGATITSYGGHLWELTRWMPGEPDQTARPNQHRVQAAMRALAQFHLFSAEIRSLVGPAPAVSDRLHLLTSAQDGELAAIQRALGSPHGTELDVPCLRLCDLTQQALARTDLVEHLSSTPALSLLPSIRDIHREHVLFSGDDVSGIIDFGALRLDTPLTDIARLLGSLVGDDSEGRRAAIEAYAVIRPLPAEDRRLVALLDESGLLGSAINWLRWLYLERRDMGPPALIVRRLADLSDRLDFRLQLLLPR